MGYFTVLSVDGRYNTEMERIGKDVVPAQSRYYPENCLKRLRTTMKNHSRDSRCPDRTPPQYDPKALLRLCRTANWNCVKLTWKMTVRHPTVGHVLTSRGDMGGQNRESVSLFSIWNSLLLLSSRATISPDQDSQSVGRDLNPDGTARISNITAVERKWWRSKERAVEGMKKEK
jgi:hypothetical protein